MAAAPVGRAGPSLRSRALVAVALTIGFYTLALVIAVGLIAAPIALFATSGRGNIWVAAALIGAGIAILRAIIPPRDRFEPPGPELRPAEHPRLHSVLQDVAVKAGQAPANSVYLDLDMNASVLEHRGRRLMVLGLPLLATLSVDELRAVVAHEYGHYVGGDTRFAGWIWRTRHAVMRTVQELATSGSWFRRNIVRWPFQWYAQLFLRITNAISRRQEFAADRLSARVASPEAAGSALRRLEALAPIYPGYWTSDVAPMLDARKRPPLAAGLYELAVHSSIAPMLDEIVKTDIEGNEADPYASHPTLRQRLEALGAPVVTAAPGPAEHPATELLENLPALERQ
ncbi:MAG TPA: M48 family metallopeptidase, partial [Thermoleophilaceae bacterium]|nr:M48 family metallopeptidase [Thermoleophilaceae bacterium]